MKQSEKERKFHQLHQEERFLVLPNIWDPIGAGLLEKIGFEAVATGSAAIANANGFPDGEYFPFNDLLLLLKRTVSNVNIPVSADIERAYAGEKKVLVENIKRLVDTGISGINYEDSHHDRPGLVPLEEQAENIHYF